MPSVPKPPPGKILLGEIIKPHGTKGDMFVRCFSGQPENLKQYKSLFLMNKRGQVSVPLSVRLCRPQRKNIIIGFEGIEKRNQLDELIGAKLLVAENELPPLPENQFYWYHYQGKEVYTSWGKKVGIVKELFSNNAQDILVVEDENSKEEFLIPVTKEILVGEEERRLIVNPPPGLLGMNFD